MNGARGIIRCLENEKVKHVFGYPGGAVLPLYEELRKSEIEHFLVRNEQSAVHYASGYARESGGVGVCFATSGPGATNLITGIATAYMDSIPVVIITGQVHSDLIGTDAFQEADIVGASEPFTKHNYLVKRAEEIPRIMKEAFYLASTGRPGPVLIDIPMNIQEQKISFEYPERVNIKGYKPTVNGHKGQIKRAVTRIKKSQRPLIYVGGGIISAGAEEHLERFVEKNKIPVVNTLMGLGSFPHTSDYYAGFVGSHGFDYSNKIIIRADLLIVIGARLSNRATHHIKQLNPDIGMIHIDIDPAEIGKNVDATIPVVGDAKDILEALTAIDIKIDTCSWLEEIKQSKERYKTVDFDDRTGFVSPDKVIRRLSDRVESTCSLVADVGQNQIWAARNFEIRNRRKFLTSGGLGTMGYSLPAATGVKVANGDKQVICVMGDGSLQMCLGELATVSEYNVGIKIILFNNQRLGMVKELQDNKYGKRANVSVEFQLNADFVKIAEGFGIKGYSVTTLEAFDEIIDRVLADDEPCLIECRVNPDCKTF